jgi:hypothetical protein
VREGALKEFRVFERIVDPLLEVGTGTHLISGIV